MDEFKARYWPDYAAHLAECERRLGQITGRPGRTLGESCSLTLSAGGKRMRPLLVFLCARKGFEIGDKHYHAAVAVEMIHMATLVHDDVLDAAELRRGQPTVVARYGPKVSVAAGDYLFSTAFEILAGADSPPAVSLLAGTSLDLSRGELLQMAEAGDLGLAASAYEERCRLKTSSLFSTSCMLGALLSGCKEPVVEALGEFGAYMGLAFQITDDILDFSDDTDQIGKQFGADLRDGTVTLPLILAMSRDNSLVTMLDSELTEERLESICLRVRKSGGLDAAHEKALDFVGLAREALTRGANELDTGPLELIAEATVDRRV